MAQQSGYTYAPAAGQEGYNYGTQTYAQQPSPVAYQGQQPAYSAPVAYAPPQQAAYSYAPQQGYYNPDEVRTIFITGFPPDIKDRELANLMRFLPGYEASQLNWKGDFAQAFALFHNGQAAYAAMQQVHNLPFDSQTSLRCEMARKNMYIKAEDGSKRSRTESFSPYGGSGNPGYQDAYQPPASGPVSYAAVSNLKDNPPCSTLFVGNMGDAVSEQELMAIFSTQPGFVTMKLVRNARTSTAFVEYADLAAAMHVHDSQQGAVLQSSDRGGLRIQYSKNPFGKKRDHAGNPVDPQTLPAIAPRYNRDNTNASYHQAQVGTNLPAAAATPPEGAKTEVKAENGVEAVAAEQAPGT